MDITFKYNNKTFTTPNLEKKLKRMKISLDDIEIINNPEPKKEVVELENIRYRYFKSPSGIIHVCTQREAKDLPKTYLFRNQIWNGTTGVKGMTLEYIDSLEEIYEKPL